MMGVGLFSMAWQRDYSQELTGRRLGGPHSVARAAHSGEHVKGYGTGRPLVSSSGDFGPLSSSGNLVSGTFPPCT
jgi:hypothetical protein